MAGIAQLVRACGHTVLARITGRNPGVRQLTMWARERLHRSYISFTTRANNYFEIEFDDPAGRDKTLEAQYYDLNGQTICISPWSPYFNYEKDYRHSKPNISLWVQIVDLPPFYRSKDMVHDLITAFAEVVAIDDTDSYKSKLSGPRIRIITSNVDTLPKTITLPRHDGKGDLIYELEYSGLPEQCGRCRSYDHTVSLRRRPPGQLEGWSKPIRKRTHPSEARSRAKAPVVGGYPADSKSSGYQSPSPIQEDPVIACSKDQQTPFIQVSYKKKKSKVIHKQPYRWAQEWRPVTKVPKGIQELSQGEETSTTKPDNQDIEPQDATPLGQQKIPPKIPFVWQPEKQKQMHKQSAPPGQNGYRTTHIHKNLWSALDITTAPEIETCAAIITPIFYKKGVRGQILLDFIVKQGKPISSCYLTHNITVSKWTTDEAKEHLVCETMLLMRTHLSLIVKRKNPLTRWEDAIWQFDIHHPSPTSSLYIWTPLIEYDEEIFTIRRREQIRWATVPESLAIQWPDENSKSASRWTLSESDRIFLLGVDSPQRIPESNSSAWLPQEGAEGAIEIDSEGVREEEDPIESDSL
jgi:hypothetical protein